jgi:hypothetical protein
MCWTTKARIRGGARRIAEQGAVAVVPPKFASRLRFDRNLIERFLNIKNFRRIAAMIKRTRRLPFVFLTTATTGDQQRLRTGDPALRRFRKVTYCFRSGWGAELYTDILSVIETGRCRASMRAA